MIAEINIIAMVIMIVCAVAAVNVRDLLGAAILFGAYSFMMCLQWLAMGAVDVGFTEATIGAGISSAFFFAAIYRTTRRTSD